MAASEIIHEEFSLGLLDGRIWYASAPFMDSQITEVHDLSRNYVMFENRGRLLTKINLPPRFVAQGRFNPGSGTPYDQFAIYLRTDGATDNKTGSFKNGIVAEFQVFGDKNIHLYEVGGMRRETSFSMRQFTAYNFKIVDNATNVILYLDNLNAPLLTLNTIRRVGNRMGFQNSEGRYGGILPNTPIQNIQFDPNLAANAIAIAELDSLTVSTGEDESIAFNSTNSQTDATGLTVSDVVPQVVLSSNNYVTTAAGKRELVAVDIPGLVLKNEVGEYNRFAWGKVNDSDLKACLTAPKLFNAVTSFGAKTKPGFKNCYAASGFERRLRNIWSQGKTLQERIKTRLEIFEAFRKYNESRASFLYYGYQGDAWLAASKGNANFQDRAWKNWEMADENFNANNDIRDPGRHGEEALKIVNRYSAEHGAYPGQASDDLRKASVQLGQASQRTAQSQLAGQKSWALAQSSGNKMFFYIDELNASGFTLNAKLPFLAIPSLNIPQEIVAELNSSTEK